MRETIPERERLQRTFCAVARSESNLAKTLLTNTPAMRLT
jgi:hypothetical protein